MPKYWLGEHSDLVLSVEPWWFVRGECGHLHVCHLAITEQRHPSGNNTLENSVKPDQTQRSTSDLFATNVAAISGVLTVIWLQKQLKAYFRVSLKILWYRGWIIVRIHNTDVKDVHITMSLWDVYLVIVPFIYPCFVTYRVHAENNP